MNYSQIFQDHFGNLPPVVRTLAIGLDQQEAWLERVRISLGYAEDWSPAYARREASGATASVRWADKANGMNGVGDMRALIAEMCQWMDLLEEKRVEIDARLSPRSAQTAAVNAALYNDMLQAANNTKLPYDGSGAANATPSCPKCGKTGRGLAMHMKSCVGKAA